MIMILLVSDNEHKEDAMKRVCAALGFSLTAVDSVQGARTKMESQWYDCVVMDYLFNNGTSSELTAHALGFPSMRLVAFSGLPTYRNLQLQDGCHIAIDPNAGVDEIVKAMKKLMKR